MDRNRNQSHECHLGKKEMNRNHNIKYALTILERMLLVRWYVCLPPKVYALSRQTPVFAMESNIRDCPSGQPGHNVIYGQSASRIQYDQHSRAKKLLMVSLQLISKH